MPETVREIVEKRVLQAINAMAQNADGTLKYPASAIAAVDVADDATAYQIVQHIVTEAGIQLLRSICQDENNNHRVLFTTDVTVAHRDRLPDCIGPYGKPVIRPHSGVAADAFEASDDSKTVEEIEDYRRNPQNIYSSVAHNAADGAGNPSPISRFARIRNKKIYFTGYECKVPVTTFTRADVDTKIPADMEDTWFKLAMGLAKKKGDGGWLTGIFNRYGQDGERDMKIPQTAESQEQQEEAAEA